jgi:hypothetical protein
VITTDLITTTLPLVLNARAFLGAIGSPAH